MDGPSESCPVTHGFGRGEHLDSPGVRHAVAGSQRQQAVSADESVRGAGHGLDGECLASLPGSKRVACEYLQPVITRASPKPEPHVTGLQPGPGQSRLVPGQSGQRVVELGVSDQPGGPEVERCARNFLRCCRRYATVVARPPVRGGDLKAAVVHDRRACGEVGMRAGSVRCGPGSSVRYGYGDLQSRSGIEPVTYRQLQTTPLS